MEELGLMEVIKVQDLIRGLFHLPLTRVNLLEIQQMMEAELPESVPLRTVFGQLEVDTSIQQELSPRQCKLGMN
jgi:hypothetical protein